MYAGIDVSLMDSTLIPAVDYKDAFFQDVREHIEPFVRNSLFQLLAYQYKGEEADLYKADQGANIPMIKREAELRGISIPDMVKMVERTGSALKSAIKDLELLRVEYNLRYSKIKEHQDKLELRDEFIVKVKAITGGLA